METISISQRGAILLFLLTLVVASSLFVHWAIPLAIVFLLLGGFLLFRYPDIGILTSLYGIALFRPIFFVIGTERAFPAFGTILLLLFIGSFILLLKGEIAKKIKIGLWGYFLLIFFFYLVVNIVRSPAPEYGAMKILFFTISGFLPFWSLQLFQGRWEKLQGVWQRLLIIGAGLLALSLGVVLVSGIPNFGRFSTANSAVRYARDMGMIAIFFLFWMEKKKNVVVGITAFGGALLATFFLVLAATRLPFIALITTLFVYIMFFSNMKWGYKIFIGAIAIGMAFLILIKGPTYLLMRFSSIVAGGTQGEMSASERYFLMKTGYTHLFDHPILGYGTGGFAILPNATLKFASLKHPHCNLLEIGVEQGIVGLILYLSIVAGISIQSLRLYLRKELEKQWKPVLLIGILIFLFAFQNSLLNDALSGSQGVWWSLGFLNAVNISITNELKEKRSLE